ncbi:MAG TPA: hypothetical protein VK403_03340 [Allosphingosinicella sp.]|nr:hypothetical protein [Allosphingosinicella sp.]
MASHTNPARPGLAGFLGDALGQLRDSRWLPIGLLFLVFLGGTNAVLALLKPAPGAAPGALFAAAGLVRLAAAVSISVAALRIATGSPRRTWIPDGGFWLYFLLGLPGLAVTASVAWVGRDLPLLGRILAMEFAAVALLAPFAVWFVAVAVERPLAFVPRFRRIGAWLPALLLWSLLLVAPLAALHAWLSQRMLDLAGSGGFWPLAAADAVDSTLFVLLALALRVTAYRVAQG